jgi:hypothetical protein
MEAAPRRPVKRANVLTCLGILVILRVKMPATLSFPIIPSGPPSPAQEDRARNFEIDSLLARNL